MLDVLLDSRAAETSGVEPYPFLYRSDPGVSVQYEAGGCGIAHHDQYLKVMGDLGLSSETAIRLPDGSPSTLGEVIRNSLANFDIGQELEFTAVAYSRWLPPTRSWVDRHGDRHSFDDIAEALMKRPSDKTSCCGAHTPYALVNLLRANQQYPILDPDVARRVEAHLVDISRRLEANQDPSGAWLGRWYVSREPVPDETIGFQAIWATGHHLEWITLAPEHLRPNRQCIERARADARPTHPWAHRHDNCAELPAVQPRGEGRRAHGGGRSGVRSCDRHRRGAAIELRRLA